MAHEFKIDNLDTAPEWWKNMVYTIHHSPDGYSIELSEHEFWRYIHLIFKEYDAMLTRNQTGTKVRVKFYNEQLYMMFLLKWA